MTDPRIYSTSVARNKDVIAEAFSRLFPDASRVLEIASGSGEHAEAILAVRPSLAWQGSDPDPEARASTQARMRDLGQAEVLDINTRGSDWTSSVEGPFDVIVAINMIHITATAGYENLFAGAPGLLADGGSLFIYGPMVREGVTEESNQRFSESLQSRDPEWGVRDLDLTLVPLAEKAGLVLNHVERVPANNHVVTFKKPERSGS